MCAKDTLLLLVFCLTSCSVGNQYEDLVNDGRRAKKYPMPSVEELTINIQNKLITNNNVSVVNIKNRVTDQQIHHWKKLQRGPPAHGASPRTNSSTSPHLHSSTLTLNLHSTTLTLKSREIFQYLVQGAMCLNQRLMGADHTFLGYLLVLIVRLTLPIQWPSQQQLK